MSTYKLSPMKLNITADNSKEFQNIIENLHILNAIPFLNDNSLTILNVTLINYEEVVNIIDNLYRLNAIQYSDWSLINLQLIIKKMDLTIMKTPKV